MRIMDEWTHLDLRVTVFHMNGRFSIKFEKSLMEQTYKFRDGEFTSVTSLREGLTPSFYKEVSRLFDQMARGKTLLATESQEDAEFDDIL